MERNKLIKTLRKCAKASADVCGDCDYYDREPWCQAALVSDAADALEAADKRIDGLQKLVDINTKRCEALRKQLRDSHESYEQRIAELEAQIPKEGEWIDLFGHDYKCSVCGEWYRMDGTPEQEDMNYCPNCGAKMKGEQE